MANHGLHGAPRSGLRPRWMASAGPNRSCCDDPKAGACRRACSSFAEITSCRSQRMNLDRIYTQCRPDGRVLRALLRGLDPVKGRTSERV